MSIRNLTLATIAAMALLAGTAMAQNVAPNWQGNRKYFHIEQRERIQQGRINRGIENGSLTPREAARLEAQQARFERVENRDRASGGGLSGRERRQLYRDQNRMSRNIYRLEHNGRGR